jgi:hypothetical protein
MRIIVIMSYISTSRARRDALGEMVGLPTLSDSEDPRSFPYKGRRYINPLSDTLHRDQLCPALMHNPNGRCQKR